MWREVARVEAVSASKRDGVGEDGAGDGIAWAETCTLHDRLDFFRLQSDCVKRMRECKRMSRIRGIPRTVKFEIVDVAIIELRSGFSDLGIRVPFEEALVC